MIVSTTPQIQGYEIAEYFGIVTGEAILGANVFKDFFAGIRDIVGLDAAALGANAVVGVDLDYETIQVGRGGNMRMVSAAGTAVRVAF